MFSKVARFAFALSFAICTATTTHATTLNIGDILVAGGTNLRTAIFRIDPMTGERTLVSGVFSNLPPLGTGPAFINLAGITVDTNGDILVVDNSADALLRVDPATGDRVVVSGCADSTCASLVGGGPDTFIHPRDVRVEADGSILVLDVRIDSILFRVDPVTGDRSIVASSAVGSDAPNQLVAGFRGAVAMEMEQDGSILVFGGLSELYRVDPVTGNRTVVSRSSEFSAPVDKVGDGADFGVTNALALEADGNILALAAAVGGAIATDPVRGVIRVDPVSGNRTLISGCNSVFPFGPSDCISVVGIGPLFQVARGMSREPDGNIIVSDRNQGFIRVDASTGDRTIMSPNVEIFSGAIVIVTGPNPNQDILVEPLAHDFGQVDAFTSKDAIVTISNTGMANLEVTDVSITSGAANFVVSDFDPAEFPPLLIPPGGDVFVTVTMFPTTAGAFEGTLTINSDDPDEPTVEVSLIGNGLAGAVEDQATVLEAAVDDAIALGTLVGSGSGNSAFGRLGAFADMIEAAGDLIEAGFVEEACDQLSSALRRIDGDPRPPDFVEGDDAMLIADQIEFLRDSLGCT